jgi:ABC-2 type transport system ATP-binding protein
MEEILSINKLSKRFGSIKAVDQLSLKVNRGDIYGFLGPNGSGKTTTLGMLTDVVKSDSGSFQWFGENPTHNHRKKIGTILEQPLFYPYLSGYRNLQVIADIKKAPQSQIMEVLDTVNLKERASSKFQTYSLGMKQRLALAAALLGDPEVLILDEPTNGLDPQGIAYTRELILKIAEKGITIILASHLLDEVQKLCTHVCVLRNGKKLFDGPVEEVLNDKASLELAADNLNLLKIACEESGIFTTVTEDKGLIKVHASEDLDPAAINKMMFERGIILKHIALKKKSLEEHFLDITSK